MYCCNSVLHLLFFAILATAIIRSSQLKLVLRYCSTLLIIISPLTSNPVWNPDCYYQQNTPIIQWATIAIIWNIQAVSLRYVVFTNCLHSAHFLAGESGWLTRLVLLLLAVSNAASRLRRLHDCERGTDSAVVGRWTNSGCPLRGQCSRIGLIQVQEKKGSGLRREHPSNEMYYPL